MESFFRRHVRRKNTLREASVEASALGGRLRRRAERDSFGGKGVSLFASCKAALSGRFFCAFLKKFIVRLHKRINAILCVATKIEFFKKSLSKNRIFYVVNI